MKHLQDMAIIEQRTNTLRRSYCFIIQSNFSFETPYQAYNGVTDILRKCHGVLEYETRKVRNPHLEHLLYLLESNYWPNRTTCSRLRLWAMGFFTNAVISIVK